MLSTPDGNRGLLACFRIFIDDDDDDEMTLSPCRDTTVCYKLRVNSRTTNKQPKQDAVGTLFVQVGAVVCYR